MVKKTNAQTVQSDRKALTDKELKERIVLKLTSRGISDPKSASDEQLYMATVQVVKELLISDRERFKRKIKTFRMKKVYYLCMEFLVGRSLKNAAISLGIYDCLSKLFEDFGTTFENIYACEGVQERRNIWIWKT